MWTPNIFGFGILDDFVSLSGRTYRKTPGWRLCNGFGKSVGRDLN